MTYSEARELIFASGTVMDGYFGAIADCSFAYDPQSQKILVILQYGFFPSLLPLATDLPEAKWLLANHPIAKKYYTVDAA